MLVAYASKAPSSLTAIALTEMVPSGLSWFGSSRGRPRSGRGVGDVEDGQVLQAVVAGDKPTAATLQRNARARVVPQLRQPVVDLGPGGDGVEVRLGASILGRDPLDRLGAVGVLEPAIGVSDRVAVQVFDDVVPAGRRVRKGHAPMVPDAYDWRDDATAAMVAIAAPTTAMMRPMPT